MTELISMQTILLIATGIVLFLYALNTLSDALKEIAGQRLKIFLDRFTGNIFKGVLSGTIVTVLE